MSVPCPGRWRAAVATAALLLLVAGPAADAATQGQGQGQNRVTPFAEIQTTDGVIAAFTATPTSGDPGPRAFDNVDRLRFATGWTNTRHLVTVDVLSATTGGQPTQTVQGTAHTIAHWVHLRQDTTTRFASVQAAGVFDGAAGAYVPPPGLTQDSQGTVALRLYDKDSPPDGGSAVTVNWVYDAGANVYWFDGTDKDFTNGNGERRVFPASHAAQTQYTFAVQGVTYAATAVAGAGANYVPTVSLAWHRLPGPAGGNTFDVYALMDFPSGAPAATYDVTIRATVATTK